MNRTIIEKVRSMLCECGLPKTFRADAANTAVHIINKYPSTAINFHVPDEVWFQSVPTYSYLRRFGCVAYIHCDEGKLKPRAKKGEEKGSYLINRIVSILYTIGIGKTSSPRKASHLGIKG
ncbi:putative mitochondrial protein (mitochondrion) [Arabidopsis thaliana]|jgi:hypothetical protein|uniref:Uncharacterized mitochondrial protein AtMg00710 n=4 Tax=Arabidopsis TaxID=3701 RepID=M710_ARATH|nr:RecName: Full=Uncharacterized mitochondrial protein AtMg00710; AltName: Full=ORF120 [Arabidopsis thaliana]KAG7528752.1 Ribonuclease H-like superfamily [Arabidopsis suecica]KAG7529229.1 Ribonuclease H-like superfamily [Arabidopsis thaliana x Arabidopsis arenosa]OAO89162.1 hypothetical protein AXX17_ATUG04060 [Arabidopsis thaliana]OAO89235.1 hypothetical protein AXX17_ATUG03360 [Arabidopsis thaliana]CAA69816.1 unnamed protein product [Arabidopsis thaliana]